ncbi:MAG TPA: hypothetical protein VF610_09570, partial [Segetibacter sp.]
MGLFSRSEKVAQSGDETAKAPVITINSVFNGLDYLVAIVKQIRPRIYNDYREADLKFKALFYNLQHDKALLLSLRKALLSQLLNSDFVPALTESGMVSARGFLQEFLIKLKHKILPPLLHPNDFLYVINHIFYRHKDHVWVQRIDHTLWKNFFEVLGIQIDVNDKKVTDQLNQSLHILIQRTVTLGLEKEVRRNFLQVHYQDYAFYKLDQAAQNYLRLYNDNAGRASITDAVVKIMEAVQMCRTVVEEVGRKIQKQGTSLSQTYILFRITQHLDRLLMIIDVLDGDKHLDVENFIKYFLAVIRNEKKKNSLREFASANFAFLAYKITEHGSSRGEKYITATRRDYWLIIKAAMGGGFIVSFTAIVKNLITKVGLPPFWQGFAYSVNYAAGFQIMHETNTTL